MIVQGDVIKALEKIESVVKGGEPKNAKDLNSANGAADGDEEDGKDLSAPGKDMNATYGNKKEEGKGKTMKSQTPESFYKSLPDQVTAKVEVSDFLKSLVNSISESSDRLSQSIVKSSEAAEARMDDVNDEIESIHKSLANVGIVLKSLCEAVGVISNQEAAAPKAATTATQSTEVVQKSFVDPNAGAEAENPKGEAIYKSLDGKTKEIQKSMISGGIWELVQKGEATDLDMIAFETNNTISPELDGKLRKIL